MWEGDGVCERGVGCVGGSRGVPLSDSPWDQAEPFVTKSVFPFSGSP